MFRVEYVMAIWILGSSFLFFLWLFKVLLY